MSRGVVALNSVAGALANALKFPALLLLPLLLAVVEGVRESEAIPLVEALVCACTGAGVLPLALVGLHSCLQSDQSCYK